MQLLCKRKIKNMDGLTPNASNSLQIMKADSLCPVGETTALPGEGTVHTWGSSLSADPPTLGLMLCNKLFLLMFMKTLNALQ